MPAPKEEKAEDAARVPVPDEGSRTGSAPSAGAANQSPAQTSTASYVGSVQQASVPAPVSSQAHIANEHAKIDEQARIRGDQLEERVPSPPPETLFDSWRMTALRSLGLHRLVSLERWNN
eukprot:6202304-Amphidinium_carterae.2